MCSFEHKVFLQERQRQNRGAVMDSGKIRILLVEDNPDDARLIQELLSFSNEDGFEIKHADDLKKGLGLIINNGIDLILLDLWLPGSQGIETLNKVREKLPEKPVVVLTAMDDPTIVMKALKEGAQNYLIKGEINSNLLVRTLLYTMEQHRLTQELKEQVEKRRLAEESLKKVHDQLEEEVRKRTDELIKTNRLLKKEIEERKKGEEELFKSEEKYRRMFELSPEAIVLVDEKGRFVDINERILDWLGYGVEEVMGKGILEVPIWDKKTGEQILKYYNMRMEGVKIPPYEIQFIAKDGSYRIGRVIASPISDENGKNIYDMAMISDITEKVMLEKQLNQAMKMEAIGRLAIGIAHNFNNILMSILGSVEVATQKIEMGHSIIESLNDIRRASDKGSELIKELLIFGRKQPVTPREIDLNSIIRGIERIIRPLIMDNIYFRTILSLDISPIKADPTQVEQIIMNLVVNARDALEDGGSLIIKTGMFIADDSFVRKHPFIRKNSYVELMIKDTGRGFDEDIMSHIFEPFFTTKELGKGTGLGLSTVYGVVKQAGGYILVDSEPGKGTTFKIYFPAIRSKSSNLNDKTSPSKKSYRGSECIMVVEDDYMVRKPILEMLTAAGYRVVPSINGGQAKQKYKYAGEEPALIIVDLLLPDISGTDLIQEIKKINPRVKTLVMSGYSEDLLDDFRKMDEYFDFIEKPFSQIDFLKKTREILDRID